MPHAVYHNPPTRVTTCEAFRGKVRAAGNVASQQAGFQSLGAGRFQLMKCQRLGRWAAAVLASR